MAERIVCRFDICMVGDQGFVHSGGGTYAMGLARVNKVQQAGLAMAKMLLEEQAAELAEAAAAPAANKK